MINVNINFGGPLQFFFRDISGQNVHDEDSPNASAWSEVVSQAMSWVLILNASQNVLIELRLK